MSKAVTPGKASANSHPPTVMFATYQQYSRNKVKIRSRLQLQLIYLEYSSLELYQILFGTSTVLLIFWEEVCSTDLRPYMRI